WDDVTILKDPGWSARPFWMIASSDPRDTTRIVTSADRPGSFRIVTSSQSSAAVRRVTTSPSPGGVPSAFTNEERGIVRAASAVGGDGRSHVAGPPATAAPARVPNATSGTV